VGSIDVATEPWQLAELEEGVAAYERAGERVELLDATQVRKEVDSPTYLGGLHRPDGGGLVDPGALVRGLAAWPPRAGSRSTRHSPSPRSTRTAPASSSAPRGGVTADRAVLATNAYSHQVLPRTDAGSCPSTTTCW
jgi:glycine/D-amino acid oxidase-like deaminating enzyme